MEFGSFYLGGRDIRITGRPTRTAQQTETVSFTHDPNGLYRVEQAYVQWFRPREDAPKIVFQHGGGLCGTIWESTPDGRPGWAQILLARGFAVYVVDNVERGRAGWCPFEEIWEGEAISRTAEEAWSLFRIGPPADFDARRPFPGQRFPVDAFEGLLAYCVPRWPRGTDLAVARLAELIARIGPCTVIGHSQGGEIAFRAAERAPDLVQSLVLVEPSGSVAGAFAPGFGAVRHLFLLGDFLDRHPVFRTLEVATRRWIDDLTTLGAPVDLLRLPGASHMMMMDENSDATAHRIADWLLEG